MLTRPFFAGDDTPVGDATIDVLPHRFLEFRLRALQGVDRRVGLDVAHNPMIGRLRDAARAGAWPKSLDPLLKCQGRRLCRSRAGADEGGNGAEPGGEEAAAGNPRRADAAPGFGVGALAPIKLFSLKLHTWRWCCLPEGADVS